MKISFTIYLAIGALFFLGSCKKKAVLNEQDGTTVERHEQRNASPPLASVIASAHYDVITNYEVLSQNEVSQMEAILADQTMSEQQKRAALQQNTRIYNFCTSLETLKSLYLNNANYLVLPANQKEIASLIALALGVSPAIGGQMNCELLYENCLGSAFSNPLCYFIPLDCWSFCYVEYLGCSAYNAVSDK